MSNSYPYACLYCECRFKYLGTRSVHVGQVHMNDILSSKSMQAEPEDDPGGAPGGKDLDYEYGFSFSTVQEASTLCEVESSLPETPPQETAAEVEETGRQATVALCEPEGRSCLGRGRGDLPAEWGTQLPPAPEPGAEGSDEPEAGTACCPPPVDKSDSIASLGQGIEYVYVDEETSCPNEYEPSEGLGSARDPLNLEEEVFEEPLAATGSGGCIDEDPDVVCLGVYAADSKCLIECHLNHHQMFQEAVTRRHTSDTTRTTTLPSTSLSDSEVGSTVRAAPSSSHPGNRYHSHDTPASDTRVSTGGASYLTSSVGDTANSCSDASGTDCRGTSSGSVEMPESGDTGSAGAPGRKEPLPILELVIMAVTQSPHRRATLSEIDTYITSRFPQLDCSKGALHKLLGDCLCRNKCFLKVSPGGSERTSSDYWMLDPEFLDTVENGQFRQCGTEEPFYRGLAAAVAAHRVHTQLERYQQLLPDVKPSTLLAAAPVAASSGDGVDVVPLTTSPHRASSSATQTSTSLLVSDVGSTGLVAANLSECGDGRCRDDPLTSDVNESVGDVTTLISVPGGPAGSADADSGGRTAGSTASAAGEERHTTGSGTARNADTKPPFTYSELSAMAILDSPHRRATFSEICTYIESQFPYYKNKTGWQKSLSMNLTRSKSFVNMPQKGSNDKGNYWRLDSQYKDTYGGILRQRLSCGDPGAVSAPAVPGSSVPAGRPHCQLRHGAGPAAQARPLVAADSSLSGLPLRLAAATVGSEGAGAAGGAAPSPADALRTGCERRNSAATPVSPSVNVSDSGGTDREVDGSSYPGNSDGDDNAPVSDTMASKDGAATLTCPSAVTSNSFVNSTDDDGGGVTAGSAAEDGHLSSAASTANTKPPFCYEELIAMALTELPHKRATLSEINAYISSHFPYFNLGKKSWQKSVHCKLSFSKYFIKVPLKHGGRRRRYCWRLANKYEDAFKNGSFRKHRLPARPQPPCAADKSPASFTADLAGGGAVLSPASRDRSTTHPTSVSRSVSDGGSTARAPTDSSHPGDSRLGDGTPASDVTASTGVAAAATSASDGPTDSVSDKNIEGTAIRVAASGENKEQQLHERRTPSTANNRPKFTQKTLIAMAIVQSPHRRATLSEICAYLARHSSKFRQKTKKVRTHTVSCTLSTSKCFMKVPQEGSNNRGSYWTIDPQYQDMYKNCNLRQNRYSKRPLGEACKVSHAGGTASHPDDVQQHRGVTTGGPGVSDAACASVPPSTYTDDSTASPASASHSVSEDGSTGRAAPDSSHPGYSHLDNDTPALDATGLTGVVRAPTSASGDPADSIGSVTDKNVEGTAKGIAASEEDKERELRETGSTSTGNSRPKFSYKTLIALAIAQSPNRRATRSEICAYLMRRVPYLKQKKKNAWMNIVSNTLYRSKCFMKVPKEGTNNRGSYWMIDPRYEDMYKNCNFHQNCHSKRPLHEVPHVDGTASNPDDVQQHRAVTTGDPGVSDAACASLPPCTRPDEDSITIKTTTGRTISRTAAASGRPSFCYAELIAMALAHSPRRRATVSEIYAYVKSRFPYYKRSKKGWQKALQCKLSLSRWFVKVPRKGDKRSPFWQLDPNYKHLFEDGNYPWLARHERQRRATAASRSARLPDTGPTEVQAAATPADGGEGDSLPLPSYLHSVKHEPRSPESPGGNDSDSFDESNESNFQNATRDEVVVKQEESTPETDTHENDASAEVPISICDVRSIKMEVFEDAVAPSGLSGCIKQDPDLDLGLDGAENTLAATREDTSYITSTGQPAPDSSHAGGSCYGDNSPAADVKMSMGDSETLPDTSSVTTDNVNSGTNTDSKGNVTGTLTTVVGDKQCFGDGGSTSAVNTKPPLTYKALVAKAIEESPHRRLTMPEIYTYLIDRFPYFEKKKKAFRRTICSTLSYNECFFKVPQEGSGFNYWMLDSKYENTTNSRRQYRRERPCHEDSAVGAAPEQPPGASDASLHERQRHASLAVQPQKRRDIGEHGSEQAAPDSSHPGDDRSEGDILAPGRKVSAEDATAPTSLSGGCADCRIGVTDDDEAGTAVGSAAAAVVKEEACGDPVQAKPPFSYEELIAMAILESPHRNATLSEIKAYISSCFPYFQWVKENWQNSVHSTLYFSKYFVKAPPDGERRNCWMLAPKYEDVFKDEKFKRHQIVKQPLHKALGVMNSCDQKQQRGSLPVRPELQAAAHKHSIATVTSTRLSNSEIGSNGRAAADSPHCGSAYCKDEKPVPNVMALTGDAGSVVSASCSTVNTVTAGSVTSSGGTTEGVAGSDSAANTRTKFTHKELITMAIMHSPQRKATLLEIYTYISDRFPSFRQNRKVWLHKISCALSASECFIKVPPEGSNNKRYYWMLGTKSVDTAATSSSPSGDSSNCSGGVTNTARKGTVMGSAAKTKPPFSYEELIAMAIMDSLHRRATKPEIVSYIARHFPYYERSNKSWQKSINCTLSFGKYFVKVRLQSVNTQGRCRNHWTLGPKYHEAVRKGKFRRLQGWKRPLRRVLEESPAATPPPGSAAVPRAGLLAAGDGHRASDTESMDDVATSSSPSVRSGNSCIGVSNNIREGTTVDSAATRTDEERSSGDSGSAGAAKTKPPFSYEELIAMAIADSVHGRATVVEIITYIARRFPYFERSNKSWQKSIQCTLSFGKYFLKVPLQGGSVTSRCYIYWMIDPKYKNKFKNGNDNLHHHRHTKPPFRKPLPEVPAPKVSSVIGSAHRLHRDQQHRQQQDTRLSVQRQPLGASRRSPLELGASGGGSAMSASAHHYCDSTTSPTSASQSVSKGGSTAPDSTHPDESHYEDFTPASDTTRQTGDARATTSASGDSVGIATSVEDGKCVGDSGGVSTTNARPSLTHKELIAMAIAQSPHRRASRMEIYTYIMRRFPYFKQRKKAWLNVIGQTLWSSKWFIKAPGEGGNRKVYYWMLDPQYENTYKNSYSRQNRHWKRPFHKTNSLSCGNGTPDHPHDVQQRLEPSSLCTASDPRVSDGGRDIAGGALPSTCPQYGRYDDSSGQIAQNLSEPDSDHHERDTAATDVTTSVGDAATLTAPPAGTADSNSDGTGTDGEETTPGSAANRAGEEQHSGEAGPAYSADTKPPFNYTELCTMALEHSPRRRATLSEIFAYIVRRFPDFEQYRGWQKRISNALVHHRSFVNVKHKAAVGRGSYWMLERHYKEMIKNRNLRHHQHTKWPFHKPLPEVPDPEESFIIGSAHRLHSEQQRRQQRETRLSVQRQLLGASSRSLLELGASGGGGTASASAHHNCDSTTSPVSASQSVSEGGSTAPDSAHLRDSHYEDYAPTSDTTRRTADAGATTSASSDSVDTAASVEDGKCVGDIGGVSTTNARPSLTHKELIAMAIAQSPHRRASRMEIYTYIMRRFPYFKKRKKAWLNVIGYNLCSSKWFIKVPGEGSNRKVYYWMLDPQYKDAYKDSNFRQNRHWKRPFHEAPEAPHGDGTVSHPHDVKQHARQSIRPQLLATAESSSLEPPSLCTAGDPVISDGGRDVTGGSLPSCMYSHYGGRDDSSPAEGRCSTVSISNPPTREGPEIQIGDSVQHMGVRAVPRVNGGDKIWPPVSCEETSIRQRNREAGACTSCSRPLFPCSVCHRLFATKHQLKVHFQVHTRERRYVCSTCGKAFRDSAMLKRHRLVHTGERPYGCDVCGRKFTRRDQLKRHRLVHTGERPYSCDVCGRKFMRCDELKRHSEVHRRK